MPKPEPTPKPKPKPKPKPTPNPKPGPEPDPNPNPNQVSPPLSALAADPITDPPSLETFAAGLRRLKAPVKAAP